MSGGVLVVGSVAYDDVETPSGARKDLLGGSATYFSLSSSRFTAPRLVGVVGKDFKPEDRALLKNHGVDLSGLVTDDSGDTFRWGGRYHADMNQRDTLYTHLNVFETFQPELPAIYRDARFVFLGNIAPELQADVLSQAKCPVFTALDTMNFWITGRKDALLVALRKVDGLIINDEEASLLTDEDGILNAARALQKFGPRTIIIKRGEHGAFLFNDDDIFYVPAYPLETVVDPTGAGDTFAGGFMGYVARTGDLSPANMRRAVVAGSVMASFCVEGFGPETLARTTLDDVRNRYEAFVRMTTCPALTL